MQDGFYIPIETNHQFVKSNVRIARDEKNVELVTGRVVPKHEKKLLSIAIGKEITELLGFNEGERVNVFLSKENRNCILLKKAIGVFHGYKLTGGQGNSNFLRFNILCDLPNIYRMSQTTVLDFDINDQKLLFVDLNRMIYRGNIYD